MAMLSFDEIVSLYVLIYLFIYLLLKGHDVALSKLSAVFSS